MSRALLILDGPQSRAKAARKTPSKQLHVRTVDVDGAWICGQIHNGRHMPVEEAEANARLIAAAPALLKALKDAQRTLARLTNPDMSDSVQHVWAECVAAEVKARAALSLARGGDHGG